MGLTHGRSFPFKNFVPNCPGLIFRFWGGEYIFLMLLYTVIVCV